MTTGNQEIQESWHPEHHDYRVGSPHLSHRSLNEKLTGFVREEITAVGDLEELPLSVLEIGAGQGDMTEVALALGGSVTATEMSRPSIGFLKRRFRTNPSFRAVFVADESLAFLGEQRFAVVLFSSVLHHIPDYLAVIDSSLGHLLPGGSVVTLADPLWYPRMPRVDYFASRSAYLAWRVTRGDYLAGLRTRIRRIRGIIDPEEPRDMAEYHVVRQGVDENAIAALLEPRFRKVRVLRYWSTQSAVLQRVGDSTQRTNCFALSAREFRG